MSGRAYEGKMLIVTPDVDKGWVVFANKHVMDDISEMGSYAIEDILGKEQPPEPGVWIWEGKVVWRSYQYFEGDHDVDVDYRDGKWRRPTDDEVAKLVRGETLWPIEDREPYVDPKHNPEARHFCICCTCNGHKIVTGPVDAEDLGRCQICTLTREEISALE